MRLSELSQSNCVLALVSSRGTCCDVMDGLSVSVCVCVCEGVTVKEERVKNGMDRERGEGQDRLDGVIKVYEREGGREGG